MLEEKPVAYAKIKGSGSAPETTGQLFLFPARGGTVVWVEIQGVYDADKKPAQGFRGFHIHEGNSCTGNDKEPFADTGAHYNPTEQEHPFHAGDLPPVLFSDGYGWMQFYTGRFLPEDVIGKTVVLHEMADDFHSQPSGDSMEKIACGEIEKLP